jgi:phospholipid transport system substrate-binding protein
LRLIATGLLAARAPMAIADDLKTAQAADFIRRSGDQLASLASAARAPGERQRRLLAFIEDVVDVEAVARFCLGRFWRTATPAQQRDYVQLFRQVLVISVAARLADYPEGGTHVTVSPPSQTDSGISVPTIVERRDAAPAHVTWVVSMDTGRPKIVDVIAEGISLRLTQRSDYVTYITRNNNDIGALISALREQAAKAG